MKILLIIYDNGSHIHKFPLGPAYIAAALRKNNISVDIYNQDYTHSPDEDLTYYLNTNEKYDFVALGIIAGYYQYRKLLSLSKAINQSSNRPDYYVLGGHGSTADPEYFIKKTGAEIVVMGEGEETIVELIETLANKKGLKGVKGIAYKDGNEVIINERRPLIQDLESIAWPAYDMFPVEYYRLLRFPHSTSTDLVMSLVTSRGCTFSCNFCYRMDKGMRLREPEAVLEEIKYLHKDFGITYILFYDELLMASTQRTVDLCKAFIKANLDIKWFCCGRLNYAKPDLLKLMKKAGCIFINYGIESLDDTVLKHMQKGLTVKIIESGIKNTLDSGISPGYNIIFGNLGETREILMRGVDFLLKYDNGAELRTIRPVTPYPGTKLFEIAIEKGLIKDTEDFYENKHLNSDLLAVNFTDLTDDEFHEALAEANKLLVENYYENKKKTALEDIHRLYYEKDVNFRGFRDV